MKALQTTSKFLLALLICGFGVQAFGQISEEVKPIPLASPMPIQPKQISGGVLNGKATSLPKPVYPSGGINVTGTVSVQVLIDESGTVISAKAISGHPLLKPGSEAAALQARFSPTLLQGQSVKVSGVITYNFVKGKSNEEKLEAVALSMFLHLIRGSVDDLDKLNLVMDSPDFIKESMLEVPLIGKEAEPLLNLKDTAANKRLEIVDSVIAASKAKVKDDWQFELGRALGELFTQLFGAADENGPDLSKLNDFDIKSGLVRMKVLVGAAPADFPPDVLQKLKELSEAGEDPTFSLPGSAELLFRKITGLIETISPENDK